LEGEGYTCGAAVLGAHSAGAPHMRQRLYWVADGGRLHSSGRRVTGDLACAAGDFESEAQQRQRMRDAVGNGGSDGCVADSRYESKRGWSEPNKQEFAATSNNCELGQSNSEGLEGAYDNASTSIWIHSMPSQSGSELVYAASGGCAQGHTSITSEQHDQTNPWRGRTAISCADGKARRIGPGITPVAHGIPARVVRVRGYGNAIVPQVAAEFIGAYMECLL
jgi:DNA (cytosine-5)-methyltransferase 1